MKINNNFTDKFNIVMKVTAVSLFTHLIPLNFSKRYGGKVL